MKDVMLGNHAASHGARLANVDVIAAYPITPQTLIVEKLSELCADGELDAKFIKVESEHSAMAACIGAEATGARAFTATSSQGLALMHELLHWASGARLPIVMAEVNRALGPGWSIWTEQTDSLAQRETGWLQFYCENNQEVLDTVIMAYRIAEQVLLPVMVVLDAFILSHTNEIVDVPDRAIVDSYLPPYQPEFKMDVNDPHAFGGLATPDNYMEMRYKIHMAMQQAKDVAVQADQEFKEIFGRSYGVVEPYKLDDADYVIMSAGAMTSMLRVIVDKYREKGVKLGLLKIKMFRPFPTEIFRKLLAGRKKIGILDRDISFGATGIFFQETKAALYPEKKNGMPAMFGYVMGLGGRDITLANLEEMVDHMMSHDEPEEDSVWIGLKK